MNNLVIAAVLAVPLMMAHPGWAHTDEQLDTIASPHGGQVRAAGPYHLELVVQNGELVLHVTDHAGSEIGTDRGEAKARIQHDKAEGTIAVKMEPAPYNMFKGTCDSQITPKTVIIVFVKLPEQDAYAARFTPLKPKSVGKEGKGFDDQHHAHDHDLEDRHTHH